LTLWLEKDSLAPNSSIPVRQKEAADALPSRSLAPILLSAVIVFIASSIMHMVLPYHKSDYRQLPDEDKLLPSLRAAGLQKGLYIFPYCTHKEMNSPAAQEKYKQGPVGMLTVFPSGPPAMPKFLAMWFAYTLIISVVVANLAAHSVMRAPPIGASSAWRGRRRSLPTVWES